MLKLATAKFKENVSINRYVDDLMSDTRLIRYLSAQAVMMPCDMLECKITGNPDPDRTIDLSQIDLDSIPPGYDEH